MRKSASSSRRGPQPAQPDHPNLSEHRKSSRTTRVLHLGQQPPEHTRLRHRRHGRHHGSRHGRLTIHRSSVGSGRLERSPHPTELRLSRTRAPHLRKRHPDGLCVSPDVSRLTNYICRACGRPYTTRGPNPCGEIRQSRWPKCWCKERNGSCAPEPQGECSGSRCCHRGS